MQDDECTVPPPYGRHIDVTRDFGVSLCHNACFCYVFS